MKIAVLGAGNIGCALSILFSQSHEVILYSNSGNTSDYKSTMKLYTEDTNEYIEGKIKSITGSLEEAVKGAIYIFITFPAFLFKEFSSKLMPLLVKNQHLVFVPGSGGAELYFKDVLEKNCTITGLQRVHAVVRTINRGLLVKQSGIRKLIKVASVPKHYNMEACKTLSELFHLDVHPMDNYLNITLVNSNSLLHTSRLYSIFKDRPSYSSEASVPLFYENWDLPSSELLITMDEELFDMIDCLHSNGIYVNDISQILKHYESVDAESLSNKIRSIKSLKGLKTPVLKGADGTYFPDIKSRYFTADFPFGLDILLAFSDVVKTTSIHQRKVSNWYHQLIGNNYSFQLSEFGLNRVEDLKELYC